MNTVVRTIADIFFMIRLTILLLIGSERGNWQKIFTDQESAFYGMILIFAGLAGLYFFLMRQRNAKYGRIMA